MCKIVDTIRDRPLLRVSLSLLVVTAVTVGVVLWPSKLPGPEPAADAPDFNSDDYGTSPDARSDDLAADLKLMWQTARGASTPQAIHAAERVFATVKLVGLTRQEVKDRIGDAKAFTDSQYNFPFYPTTGPVLVYRFDNGAWGGGQYNVRFDPDDRVIRVQYLMIE
ncbi:hypothetical protein [Limnoglobus roseus]|uniref:Uncharacterized protein n=1 Tax=Limnoglobus roseus TaxID=2598579 RepID=A0A5C1ABH9_9BACT|nr:hypothetical protein [Limnoglobus roseus]QEL15577.1 hypothetical protein PX52LOC_02504 [Limnoglobus roseus]